MDPKRCQSFSTAANSFSVLTLKRSTFNTWKYIPYLFYHLFFRATPSCLGLQIIHSLLADLLHHCNPSFTGNDAGSSRSLPDCFSRFREGQPSLPTVIWMTWVRLLLWKGGGEARLTFVCEWSQVKLSPRRHCSAHLQWLLSHRKWQELAARSPRQPLNWRSYRASAAHNLNEKSRDFFKVGSKKRNLQQQTCNIQHEYIKMQWSNDTQCCTCWGMVPATQK